MGNVKYSKILTSNGEIEVTKNKPYQREFDSYEYLKLNGAAGLKIYINNSQDYILMDVHNTQLILEDFQINHIKVEVVDNYFANEIKFKYYVAK